jgi:FkbM family methyltransferase
MEERSEYNKNGLFNTIWVEANTQIFNSIKSNGEIVFNYAISNVDGEVYNLNVTNNGQSSSILELDKHKIHHPQIFVSNIIKIDSKRMDTLISENNIDISEYDFINLDIQGAELLALKGFGDLLSKFKFIYTEVNTNTLYKNCALIDQIDEYVSTFGFSRVETSMTEFEWGDALYIR